MTWFPIGGISSSTSRLDSRGEWFISFHSFQPTKSTKSKTRSMEIGNLHGITCLDMGVSKNRGTPKSSFLIGFSIINHPFWGPTIFGNTYWHLYPINSLKSWIVQAASKNIRCRPSADPHCTISTCYPVLAIVGVPCVM